MIPNDVDIEMIQANSLADAVDERIVAPALATHGYDQLVGAIVSNTDSPYRHVLQTLEDHDAFVTFECFEDLHLRAAGY